MLASGKRCEYGLHPVTNVSQSPAFRQLQDFRLFIRERPTRAAQTLGPHNSLKALNVSLQLVVYQNIVVFVIILNLTSGRDQPALNHLLGVLTAFTQAPFQGLAVGWQNKDADGVRQALLDLACSLDVNVEKQIMALLFRLAQEAAGSAVQMTEDFGKLEEFIIADHLLELHAGNKKVLLAVLFATACRARGIRDGKVQVGNHF